MNRIKLEFDKRTHPYGSKEHFWHFLLGYLLPSVHFYFSHSNNQNAKASKETLLVYDDCGPLMNPQIMDIAQFLDIPYEIISGRTYNQSQSYDEVVFLPRWDARLFKSIHFFLHRGQYTTDISIKKEDLKKLIRMNIKAPFDSFKCFKKEILFTRKLILDKIDNQKKTNDLPFLFLDRSDSHNFYNPEGKAENKGYGKSRRALKNLENGCSKLNEKGIFSKIYEPGAHTLIDQIKTFHNAKGIIGIRGAELANMIWQKPGSSVAVIGFMQPSFHLYNYASILNIKLNELKSDSDYPDITKFNFKNLIEK